MNRLDKTNMEIEILFEHIAKMEGRIVELEELKKWLSYSDEEAVQEASKVIAEEASRRVTT